MQDVDGERGLLPDARVRHMSRFRCHRSIGGDQLRQAAGSLCGRLPCETPGYGIRPHRYAPRSSAILVLGVRVSRGDGMTLDLWSTEENCRLGRAARVSDGFASYTT